MASRQRALLIALVVAALALVWWVDLPAHADVARLRALVDAYGALGPLVFAAIVAAGTFSYAPMLATLLIAAGGVVLGGTGAVVWGWIGALAGTIATFAATRSVARDGLTRVLDGRFARLAALDRRLVRYGFWTVLGLRMAGGLTPVLNWGLGLTSVRFRDYVTGTALGIVPGIVVTVLLADAAAGGVSWPSVSVGAVVAFGALALGGIVVARRRTRYAGFDSSESRSL